MDPASTGSALMQSPRAGQTLVVVNPGSRSGSSAPDDLVRALADAGVAVGGLRATSEPEEIASAVKEAVAQGVARVIVGGGDGTLSLIAGLLAGRDVVLGVLPLGTGNDFARNLHIPRNVEAACRVIAGGRERSVPLGFANGRVFLNAVSFGISSAVTRRLTPELKRQAGPMAYPVAAAAEAIAPKAFRLVMDADCAQLETDALQVVVGNGRYHGAGTMVAPDATLGDAQLDVYVVDAAAAPGEEGVAARAGNAWTLARVGLLLRRGRHLEHDRVRHYRCTRASFTCDPPQEVNADGELTGETPVSCEVRPSALRVLVP
jgi:YegS/Rv2252/BmrU family lipid kinase